VGEVLSGCVQTVVDVLQHKKDVNKLRLLNNLLTLIQWETNTDKIVIRYVYIGSYKSYH